jgi:geranylgeranyl pyrophosphate synthase
MNGPSPDRLRDFAVEFDRRFGDYLTPRSDIPCELLEAIRYSALAPGKRIRPYLAVRCSELVGGSREDAWAVAAAVECVHTFSLVHDDLPAMDDDDLRRGRPTTHKQFGEAVASLAGDALVVLAFELLAHHAADRRLAGEMVLELAERTGWAGMIGGQAADIAGQSQSPSLERTQFIHERKTAALFEAACRLGAMAGRALPDAVTALGGFGRCLGRAFQIADDLLDVISTAEKSGKAVGKDVAAGKQSYPRCVGVERSRAAANAAAAAAVAELERFGAAADDLRELARYVASRAF